MAASPLLALFDEQKELGEIIIGNLSSRYLQASLKKWRRWPAPICTETPSGEENASATGPVRPCPEDVETVLKAIQLFDPAGVAARTPQECLLIQIKALGYDRDQVLVDLVRDHLEDLEAHRYKPLLRKFELDMDELKEYLDIIQSLDPMPGASFGEGVSTFVSPDVLPTR